MEVKSIDRKVKFEKITEEHKEIFEKFTNQFPPYSDFNLLSILCWNQKKDNSFVIINDTLVIKLKNYLEDNYVYSILGNYNLEKTMDRLLIDYSVLSLVPEPIAKRVKNNNKFKIEINPNEFDYIIETNKIIKLYGITYKPLRRKLKSFYQKYPMYNFRKLDLSSQKDCDSIINLTREWCENKSLSKNDILNNINTIKNFINYSPYFRTISFGLVVDQQMVAFSLNEELNHKWIMGHFGKSDNGHANSSFFLEYLTAKIFFNNGYKYINIQQDAGLDGLKTAKEIFRPSFYLKKFTISKL